MTMTQTRTAQAAARKATKPIGDRALALAAIEDAEAIFNARADGIDPQQLVALLQARGYLLRIAAAALDHLESSKAVAVDPATGWLHHWGA